MRTAILIIGLSLLAGSALSAVPSDVVYAEGESNIRYKTGKERPADIGDKVDTGDTVKTGSDGLVELNQKGVVLKINPDTVFTLAEKEQGGSKTGVLSVVLGSVKFRYDRITGKEPLIQTSACVAGVRGTELSVFAGVDGSSLIVVDQGLVTVEAGGQSVELEPEEGVEVRPGQAPGDKFKVQRDQIDYRKWNDEKLQGLMADPIGAIGRVRERMDFYIQNVQEYLALYKDYSQRLAEERDKQKEIAQSKGLEEARKYEKDTVFPLSVQAFNLSLNARYYALAAFSLRRYVGGRMYLLLKSKFITNFEDSAYAGFLLQFGEVLDRFEHSIVPYLVEADI